MLFDCKVMKINKDKKEKQQKMSLVVKEVMGVR